MAIVWPSIDTSYVNASTVCTVNLLCFIITVQKQRVLRAITWLYPTLSTPLFVRTRGLIMDYIEWIFVLISITDSSARNVLDADEVSTRTIGWDAREAACTISRVSRVTRANDNFPPARSLRSRKDTFSVNYTTWRVWRFSHPTTLRKKVIMLWPLFSKRSRLQYTYIVYKTQNRLTFLRRVVGWENLQTLHVM